VEVIHQLAQRVQLMTWGLTAFAVLMTLLMTRVVYGLLRAHTQITTEE
jgi:hypothetical protein